MIFSGRLQAVPSPIGTGLISNVSLGALADPSKVNRKWYDIINYDVDLTTWKYDVYVPVDYDGTKPYGLVVYTSSNSTGAVLSTAATSRNLIWIAPHNVGNGQGINIRLGASLLAFYRAKELFNIDPRRVYSSGLSGGARTASALAFYHSELIHGTTPSSGFGLPRLSETSPNYIQNTSGNGDSYYDYSGAFFGGEAAINAEAIVNKLRSYLITRYGDHREDYFLEAFHCAYEPQGLTTFLYDGPGGHQDANDAEMMDAIDYLDRNDVFPIDAKASNSFANLTNISQAGAQAANTSSAKRLTPSLSAVAAVKSATSVYWDNRNGSTFHWLWEMGTASPQNQKTCFGVWSNGETWNGGPPTSLAAASKPGFLITLTQTAAGNRIVISAHPDSGGETIFYDGSFSFVTAFSTAQTGTQGYLPGSPVEIRLELNEKRFQITFNGIALNTATSTANGVSVAPDYKRSIFGVWDSALGSPFWNHDPNNPSANTWSPFTKAIFTASTGAASASGVVPSPMDLRYVLVSDPGLPSTGPIATFYKHWDYGGYAVSLPGGTYSMGQLIASGIANDDVSSVKVMPGYAVSLYEHGSFDGRSLTLTSDNACLNNSNFNDQVSSIKIVQVSKARQAMEDHTPSVTVYPNPSANGYFNVDLSGFGKEEAIQVVIRTVMGQVIATYQVKSNDAQALRQQAKLGAGIYLVTVQSNRLSTTKKLIVK